MKNATTTIPCVVYGGVICCIILFCLQKLAQMLNRQKQRYGFELQTWRIRCKRNKAAVDKAFMPCTPTSSHKNSAEAEFGASREIGDARTIWYLRVECSFGTLRWHPGAENGNGRVSASSPVRCALRKIKATPARCADAPPWKVTTDCARDQLHHFTPVRHAGPENEWSAADPRAHRNPAKQ